MEGRPSLFRSTPSPNSSPQPASSPRLPPHRRPRRAHKESCSPPSTEIAAANMDTNIPRRPPVRLDTQDGPWSVSVAESPHDSRSYSLYIKTPTHNLTLTRTAMEILDLDQKLRDTNPNVKIPPLPINPDALQPPPKRKSNFLNTLSRLASPTSNKTGKRSSHVPSSSLLPTPIASPTGEINDPFTSFSPNNVNSPSLIAAPSTTSTGLAAYLTTVSNTATLRQARIWKRFVRVRTDDLESVRVERAIKRVRSDLAAHVGGLPSRDDLSELQDHDHSVTNMDELDHQTHVASSAASDDSPLHMEDSLPTPVQSPKELAGEPPAQFTEDASIDAIKHCVDEVTYEDPAAPSPQKATLDASGVFDARNVASEDIPGPTTPTMEAQDEAQAPTQRIHRSHSADPAKSSRYSRAFAQSAPANTITEADGGASSATGDDSSISTDNRDRRERKKRSKSTTAASEKKFKDKGPKKSQRKVVIDDFEMMRVLGKGCAGKVLLVKHKSSSDMYALKAITKRHVLAHQELQHTLTEQAVLKRMAAEGKDPFVVKLWWSFHDKENLFLVMDFHPGGDLATQLARWGRLGRDRARFYAAEIVEGVEGLHAAGVIYRDLKPENILIGSDGHIVLTDFGLSKEFPRPSATGSSTPLTPTADITASASWMRPGSASSGVINGLSNSSGVGLGLVGNSSGDQVATWTGSDQTTTFCGTAEYLAPEVIQGLPYSYEVDWWSFGTMLYEMLTGITPFWANNHSDMYVRVLQDSLEFPEDRAIDQDTKSLIRGLLQKTPALRICEPRIKRHPYFSMIDWSHVYYKRYIPPYIPPIDPSNASDTQNFDETFLDMEPVLDEYVDEQTTDTDADVHTDTDRTDGEETATTPSQSRSSSIRPHLNTSVAATAGGGGMTQGSPIQVQGSEGAAGVLGVGVGAGGQQQQQQELDVFDGYSFKGRYSMVIDSSDDEDEDEDEDEDDEDGDEEGSGSEMTGVSGTRTTSSEADEVDDSSVRGSAVITPDAAVMTREVDTSIEEGEGVVEEVEEPKTPEARPISAPSSAVDEVSEDISRLLADAKALEHRLEEGDIGTPTEERPKTNIPASAVPETPAKTVVITIPETPQVSSTTPLFVPSPPSQQQEQEQQPQKTVKSATRNKRRERSGIPALDKDLPEESETGEDAGAVRTFLDDEDDDWDFVEAVDGEDRNGAKGTSLFARGVVDKYRLAVFRKASTPSRHQSRTVSGASSRNGDGGGDGSPTRNRGRAALAFTRKGTRQFLQPKNNLSSPGGQSTPTQHHPPPSAFAYSSKKSMSALSANMGSVTPSSTSTMAVSNSMLTNASGTTTTIGGLLTPSMSGANEVMMLKRMPSLKSRESAMSVGAKSVSSDQSVSGGNGINGSRVITTRNGGDLVLEDTNNEQQKVKTAKKLKKYKEGAEKMFSLFSGAASPRQHHHAS